MAIAISADTASLMGNAPINASKNSGIQTRITSARLATAPNLLFKPRPRLHDPPNI